MSTSAERDAWRDQLAARLQARQDRRDRIKAERAQLAERRDAGLRARHAARQVHARQRHGQPRGR